MLATNRVFRQMRNEMNRLAQEFTQLPTPVAFPTGARIYPAVNIWQEDDHLFVEAEVPGMLPENLDIAVVGPELTIRGQFVEPEVKGNWRRRERMNGEFARTLTLPIEVDPDRVEARLVNGVLTIRLDKAEAVKPRKILVKPAVN